MGKKLKLIGIGAGNPEWLTIQAIQAIESLDVLFIVIKENNLDELVDIRREILARYRTTKLATVQLYDPPRPWQTTADYPKAVAEWRAQRKLSWAKAIDEQLPDGKTGGFLVWGDPSLYESTLAIVKQAIAESPELVELTVIPGVSSVLALATAHQIPLNRQGEAVQICPARLIREGIPAGVNNVVVMLDGKQTFAKIDPAGIYIYWGAYLGTPDEILASGLLSEVKDDILALRSAAVARKGWIFDTYLLRRV